MEVTGESCSLEVVSLRLMVALFVETVVVEMVLPAYKSIYYLMGSLFNRTGFLEHAGGNNQGNEGSIVIGMEDVTRIGIGCQPDSDEVPPENKDDGDSDDEDEDEDGEEQDEDGEENKDEASGDENKNPGNDDAEDDAEANGEGASDDEEEDEDEDEDEDDDDDDDEEEGDEDDEEEEDEEEEEDIPEPPTKKRK